MRALAIPLEICNGFKLLRKSDIFIVWGWDSGQPWTIIRGIFRRDVSAQMLNLNSTIVSFVFSGALKLKLDTCMTCASSEKYPRAWRALAPLHFFRDALCFASLAWRARAMRLEGQVHLSGAHQWRKEDNKNRAGPTCSQRT